MLMTTPARRALLMMHAAVGDGRGTAAADGGGSVHDTQYPRPVMATCPAASGRAFSWRQPSGTVVGVALLQQLQNSKASR